MSSSCLLSLLIPSYNYQAGLKRILFSFDCLGYPLLDRVEVIIGDDSRTPLLGQSEILYFKSKFSRFLYIHNRTQSGAVSNWNNLIHLASGKYYWLCHHDEVLLNPADALPYILYLLEAVHINAFILPLYKKLSLAPFLPMLLQRMTPLESFLPLFLRKPDLILQANPLGPPSVLIVNSSHKFFYDIHLEWLVDVECYVRMFSLSKLSYSVFPPFCGLLSDSKVGFSITSSLLPRLADISMQESSYVRGKLLVSGEGLPLYMFKGFLYKLILKLLRLSSFFYLCTP